jgi:hypothetical protein
MNFLSRRPYILPSSSSNSHIPLHLKIIYLLLHTNNLPLHYSLDSHSQNSRTVAFDRVVSSGLGANISKRLCFPIQHFACLKSTVFREEFECINTVDSKLLTLGCVRNWSVDLRQVRDIRAAVEQPRTSCNE